MKTIRKIERNCSIGNIELYRENGERRKCPRLNAGCGMSRSLDIALGTGFQCYTRADDDKNLNHHYGISDCHRITRGGEIRKMEDIDHFRFVFFKKEIKNEVKKVKTEWLNTYSLWIKKHIGELDG